MKILTMESLKTLRSASGMLQVVGIHTTLPIAARMADRFATAGGETPLSALRPIFSQLRDTMRLTRIYSRILKALYQIQSGGVLDFHIPPYAGDWSLDVSRELRKSLTTHLFGWNSIQSLRMRYAVAVFCQVCGPSFTSPRVQSILSLYHNAVVEPHRNARDAARICQSCQSISGRHPKPCPSHVATAHLGPKWAIEP